MKQLTGEDMYALAVATAPLRRWMRDRGAMSYDSVTVAGDGFAEVRP